MQTSAIQPQENYTQIFEEGLEDNNYWPLGYIEPKTNSMNNTNINLFVMKRKKPILSNNIPMTIEESVPNIVRIENLSSCTWNFCKFEKNKFDNISHQIIYFKAGWLKMKFSGIYMKKYYLGVNYIYRTTLKVYENYKLYFLYRLVPTNIKYLKKIQNIKQKPNFYVVSSTTIYNY